MAINHLEIHSRMVFRKNVVICLSFTKNANENAKFYVPNLSTVICSPANSMSAKARFLLSFRMSSHLMASMVMNAKSSVDSR